MTRAVFFDMGNTLEDESAAETHLSIQACAALAKIGVAVSLARFDSIVHARAADLHSDLFFDTIRHFAGDDETARRIRQSLTWDKSRLRLYDDTESTLKILSANHRLGIIANQSAGMRERLAAYGISGFFSDIFDSSELGIKKPDRRIFELATKSLPPGIDEVWMIGDRVDNDIEPAKSLGWKTIRVLHGYRRRQIGDKAGQNADFTVTELNEIPEILS